MSLNGPKGKMSGSSGRNRSTNGFVIAVFAALVGTFMACNMSPRAQNEDEASTDETTQIVEGQAASDGQAAEETYAEEEEIDDQFEGFGEEGLLGSLPNATVAYQGDMDGFPIEFTITKNDNSGEVNGTYKNVKYGTTMELFGESLPAMCGDICFYGNDGDTQWLFTLTGDATHITGIARSGEKELKVTLNKK